MNKINGNFIIILIIMGFILITIMTIFKGSEIDKNNKFCKIQPETSMISNYTNQFYMILDGYCCTKVLDIESKKYEEKCVKTDGVLE